MDFVEFSHGCIIFILSVEFAAALFTAAVAFARASARFDLLREGEGVIGPEEMPILVLGRRKRPQLKRDRPKTYKF